MGFLALEGHDRDIGRAIVDRAWQVLFEKS
jgi:hypothetical protein